MSDGPAGGGPEIAFRDAALLWLKVGVLSFGGAAAQIAMLHRFVVDERRWLDDAAFTHLLNYCMLLPGPEAQQLATYIGWTLHGVRGGLFAGAAFVLPGALVMWLLCLIYVLGAGLAPVEGLFFGVKCAVLAIIAEALLRIARRAMHGRIAVLLAVVAFLALLVLQAPFPLVVVGAALFAAVADRYRPSWFGSRAAGGGIAAPAAGSGGLGRLVRTVLIWTAVWFGPVAVAALVLGASHVLVDIGLFFSKLAMLTFGGAYALLAWLAQDAVAVKGWVSAPEMLDGLGLAETTPGPTILVNQFVAFLAGWRNAAPFSPLAGATLAAAMAVWVTFVPSFLWIFAGAPYVEAIRRERRLVAALAGITAAVVGVVAYLAFVFALKVLFARGGEWTYGPLHMPTVDPLSLNPAALVLTVLAGLMLLVWHRGLFQTLAAVALAGIAARSLGWA
jgi:chromate transporter